MFSNWEGTLLQAGYLYRFRPKLNMNYLLARNEDADHGLRTTLHDQNRTLLQLTVFRTEPSTDNRYPTSLFIGNPVSGANVDVAGSAVFHEAPVVGWGFNGGDNQQWYAERMPESVQQEIDQSGWH